MKTSIFTLVMITAAASLFFRNPSHSPAVDLSALDSPVYGMDELPYGRSFSEWTQDWWRHMMSFPCEEQPLKDQHGSNVEKKQTAPVYFLPGTNDGFVERHITVPTGKSILFPVLSNMHDFPCPDKGFGPDPDQTVESFLAENARRAIDRAQDLTVMLDGKAIEVKGSHRVTTGLFYFIGEPSLAICYDACITGEAQEAVSDGYWMMLKPLEPGVHTLQFGGEVRDFAYRTNTIYHIVVRAEVPQVANAF